MDGKKERHVYKVSDTTTPITQLFVFNIVRYDDEIELEDIYLLISTGENDHKIVLSVQSIMEQIANRPKDTITTKRQDVILNEIFDDVVAQIEKKPKTPEDLKQVLKKHYPDIDQENPFDPEYLLYAMDKIEDRQLTKHQGIVDQLLNKKQQ